MIQENPRPTSTKVSCEIVDVYYPVFEDMRQQVDQTLAGLPDTDKATLTIIADELAQALLLVSRDDSSKRQEIIDSTLQHKDSTGASSISPEKLKEVVTIVADKVESSDCDPDNLPNPVPFMFRNWVR